MRAARPRRRLAGGRRAGPGDHRRRSADPARHPRCIECRGNAARRRLRECAGTQERRRDAARAERRWPEPVRARHRQARRLRLLRPGARARRTRRIPAEHSRRPARRCIWAGAMPTAACRRSHCATWRSPTATPASSTRPRTMRGKRSRSPVPIRCRSARRRSRCWATSRRGTSASPRRRRAIARAWRWRASATGRWC